VKAPLLILAITTASLAARSQHRHPYSDLNRQRLYIANARDLSRLYGNKDFDSIRYYIDARMQAGDDRASDLNCQAILLSIQRGNFYRTAYSDLDANGWLLLIDLRIYAIALAQSTEPRPSAHLYYARHGRGDKIVEANRQLFTTTSRWASDLLATGNLDSTETWLCRVLAGEIPNPDDALIQTQMPALLHALDRLHQPAEPPRYGMVITVGPGLWTPGGHLALFGNHPAISYSLGARTWHNEISVDMSLRFGHSQYPYTLLRHDTIMTRTYYDGGNVSLMYTRFLIHTTHWEIGPTAGIGGDFISFTSDYHTDWSPSAINTLDLSIGLRANYYFHKGVFFGVVARYHSINYNNRGGSPLDGHAATLDLVIGAVHSYRH
jgi:hypothetical protein